VTRTGVAHATGFTATADDAIRRRQVRTAASANSASEQSRGRLSPSPSAETRTGSQIPAPIRMPATAFRVDWIVIAFPSRINTRLFPA
jgi:hypothetical protein